MIKAFLFDFDGVIADTEVPTYESWREVYADYGVELPVEDWLPAVGTGSSTPGGPDVRQSRSVSARARCSGPRRSRGIGVRGFTCGRARRQACGHRLRGSLQ